MIAAALVCAAVASPTLPALADAVVARLEAAKLEGPVGLVVQAAEPALARAVSTVVCGALSRARASCEVIEATLTETEGVAHQRGVSTLVRLLVSLEGETLVVRGDALETWQNFWSGARAPRGPRASAIALRLAADAEVTTLAGPVAPPAALPLELKLTSIARLPSVPVALAAGDIDGDRRAELVVLSADELLVLTAEGRALARADLSAGPPSPLQSREPFGAVSVHNHKIVAWSGRRARAEVFAWVNGALQPQGPTDGVPLDGLTARLDLGLNRFLPELGTAGRAVRLPSGFQASSTRAGVTLIVWPDGTASLGRQLPPTGRLLDVGCGSALADVDGDGTPELLTSTARTSGDADELRLLSLATAEALNANAQSAKSGPSSWQAALKGRALVMAGADLDGAGEEAFVIGTWLSDGTGELFVARRVKP